MDDPAPLATAVLALRVLHARRRCAVALLTIGCDPDVLMRLARHARRQGFCAVEGLALVPSRTQAIAGNLSAFREQDPGTGLAFDDGDVLTRLAREDDAMFDIAIVGRPCDGRGDDRLRQALDRVADRWFDAPLVAQLSSDPSFNTLAPLSCSIR